MSIYATLWSIKVQDPASPWNDQRWVTVTAQAVPPHLGSPTPGCGYENGDPYGGFLPPPVETDEHSDAEFRRAVVFVTDDTEKGTDRSGQEYVSPLLVLTGEEYATMTFDAMLDQLREAIRRGPPGRRRVRRRGGRDARPHRGRRRRHRQRRVVPARQIDGRTWSNNVEVP